jgi:AMP phosphorylase
MDETILATEAIQKNLQGKPLTYKEIYAVMDQISHKRLDKTLTTYFAAAGYFKDFSKEEIFFLTKAMIETGEKLRLSGIVADKHSIGGVPGGRTSMIVIPIVAAAGFTIPKSSSRAITTAGGTADVMEVLAPVSFTKEQIKKLIEKVKACIVWGGGVDIAPADDELIKVEEPLRIQSLDKILVSIMAKKIAFGSNHIIIDIPYGDCLKLRHLSDAERLKRKFTNLAESFKVKLKTHIHKTIEPLARGIGPVLEAREVLKILEQDSDRPADLERESLHLAGMLLEICLENSSPSLKKRILLEFGDCANWAGYILTSGHAHKKMKEIIAAQGGDSNITSAQLKPAKFSYTVTSTMSKTITSINSKNASIIAKILGAPVQKKSGIYFHHKSSDHVLSGQPLFTLYSQSEYNLKEAKESLPNLPIMIFGD